MLIYFIREEWEILPENCFAEDFSDMWSEDVTLHLLCYFLFLIYGTLFVFSFYYHYNLDKKYRRVKFIKGYKDTVLSLYMIMIFFFHSTLIFEESENLLMSLYVDFFFFVASKGLYYFTIYSEEFVTLDEITFYGYNLALFYIWFFSFHLFLWFIYMHMFKEIFKEPCIKLMLDYLAYINAEKKNIYENSSEEDRELQNQYSRINKEQEEIVKGTKNLLKEPWERLKYWWWDTKFYIYFYETKEKIKKTHGIGIYRRIRSNTKDSNNKH